jgi:hypothetical protein
LCAGVNFVVILQFGKFKSESVKSQRSFNGYNDEKNSGNYDYRCFNR